MLKFLVMISFSIDSAIDGSQYFGFASINVLLTIVSITSFSLVHLCFWNSFYFDSVLKYLAFSDLVLLTVS